jgi:hypothetical protein
MIPPACCGKKATLKRKEFLDVWGLTSRIEFFWCKRCGRQMIPWSDFTPIPQVEFDKIWAAGIEFDTIPREGWLNPIEYPKEIMERYRAVISAPAVPSNTLVMV